MSETIYCTIEKAGQNELVIKKSRFICHVARIQNEDEAQAFIAQIKKANYKANHNVFAYLLEDDDHIQRESDDGEPSGTAGVPTLKTLQEMGLKDMVAVTTRFFGGIKLGAGGLIRAYSNSVQDAVHQVGIVARVTQQQVQVTIDYAQLVAVQHFLAENNQPVAATQYTQQVTLVLNIDQRQLDALHTGLVDLLAAKLTWRAGKTVFAEVPLAPKSE